MKLEFTFAASPAVVEQRLVKWNDRIQRKLGNDVLANLQNANPVDTGYSRGRWTFTPASTAYGPARITNDAKYILVLNAGHSKQAASGWIEAAFQAAVRFLR